MDLFERIIFIFIVSWACLKLTGVIGYIQASIQLKGSKRSAERWACYVVMHGDEQELRCLVKDYRALLKDKTITRALNRLTDILEEKEKIANLLEEKNQ